MPQQSGPDITQPPFASPPAPAPAAEAFPNLERHYPIQDQTDVVEFVGDAEAQFKLLEAIAKASATGIFDDIKKTKKGQIGHLHFHYAPLQAILSVIRKPLAENGLALLQFITGSPLGPNHNRITTVVCGHGARIQAVFDFEPGKFSEDRAGSPAQRLGKTWTYLRRMQLQALLCLAGDVDDDDDAQGERPGAGKSKQPKPQAAQPTQPAKDSKPAARQPPQNKPPAKTTAQRPAVGRIAQTRAAAAAKPVIDTTVATKVPEPTPEPPPDEGPVDWPERSFISPDEQPPVADPDPVEIGGPPPPPPDTPPLGEPSPPQDTPAVTEVTPEQKATLRELCQTAGITKAPKINAFVRGICGPGINSGNINAAHADKVIGALRKLIADQSSQ